MFHKVKAIPLRSGCSSKNLTTRLIWCDFLPNCFFTQTMDVFKSTLWLTPEITCKIGLFVFQPLFCSWQIRNKRKCQILYPHKNISQSAHLHKDKGSEQRRTNNTKKPWLTRCLTTVKRQPAAHTLSLPLSIWATTWGVVALLLRQCSLTVVLILVKHYFEWPNSIVAVFSLAV